MLSAVLDCGVGEWSWRVVATVCAVARIACALAVLPGGVGVRGATLTLRHFVNAPSHKLWLPKKARYWNIYRKINGHQFKYKDIGLS